MAVSRIRIHAAEGHNGQPATVIGVSRSEVDLFGHPKFRQFAEENGLSVREVPESWSPRGGISAAYVEVQPPLDDDQLRQFGAICVGGMHNGNSYRGIVEDGFVIDNRHSDPQHYDPADLLAPVYA